MLNEPVLIIFKGGSILSGSNFSLDQPTRLIVAITQSCLHIVDSDDDDDDDCNPLVSLLVPNTFGYLNTHKLHARNTIKQSNHTNQHRNSQHRFPVTGDDEQQCENLGRGMVECQL